MEGQHFLEYIPHSLALLDSDWRVREVNSRFEELLGFHRGDSLGELVHHADYGDIADDLRSGVAVTLHALAGRPGDFTLQMVAMDQQNYLLICTSVETATIRSCQESIQGLLETVHEAILMVDSAGYVTACNAAVHSIIRGELLQITGQPVRDLLEIRYRDRVIPVHRLLEQAHEEAVPIHIAGDVALVTAGGTRKIDMTLTPLRDSRATVIAVRDMEEYLRMREEFRALQHANNVVRAARGLSADLADKLTALRGALDLADDRKDKDERNMGSTVLSRTERVVERFRRFAAGSDATPGEAASLTETIMDVVDLALYGTAVRATFALDSDLADIAFTPEGFGQALYNVVANGVDAMTGEGVLHVEGKVGGPAVDPRGNPMSAEGRRMIRVVVRDEGHGMDPAMVPLVTTPYMTTKDTGAGMGLAVTRSIMERLGGGVSIETDPGFGTTVTLLIPFGEPQDDLPVTTRYAAANNAQSESFAGLTVLLVEGDVLVRNSVERILSSQGSTTISVQHGDAAIDVLRRRVRERNPVDLVIISNVLPGRLDGIALLARLREIDQDIRAVLSLGALGDDSPGRYRTAGFQTILRKPFGVDQLRRALRGSLV